MSTNFLFSYDGLQMDYQTDITKDQSITRRRFLRFPGEKTGTKYSLCGSSVWETTVDAEKIRLET